MSPVHCIIQSQHSIVVIKASISFFSLVGHIYGGMEVPRQECPVPGNRRFTIEGPLSVFYYHSLLTLTVSSSKLNSTTYYYFIFYILR